MSLRYQLLKDKQIMGGNYPKFDFLFYERSFTLITLRMERRRRHEWDLKWGHKGPTSPSGEGEDGAFPWLQDKRKDPGSRKMYKRQRIGLGRRQQLLQHLLA